MWLKDSDAITHMCGFSFYFNCDDTNIVPAFDQIRPRGPEVSTIVRHENAWMGFHRLCINGLKNSANQPFIVKDSYLLCNGEIYNHLDLERSYSLYCPSGSDCEVIIRRYNALSFTIHDPHEAMLLTARQLDGEFAFVLYDPNNKVVHICRDHLGVRPLYWARNEISLGISSELKGIHPIFSYAEQFPAGTLVSVPISNVTSVDSMSSFLPVDGVLGVPQITKFFDLPTTSLPVYWHHKVGLDDFERVRQVFKKAVKKRLMSDRPVCALLSGGLDSSLVASIVANTIAPRKLDTYSIGMKGGTDLKYARLVADHIGSNHHEIELTEGDFLSTLEETVRIIESYDITSVRASVGNLLVAKYIKENSMNKVVFNGDYSDEVAGGYLYLKNAPSEKEFHQECCRLVQDIIYFDSLRSDRCISSQGLEARVPFSDPKFVSLYLSLNIKDRMQTGVIEKNILRQAFERENLLPPEVLWRRKEAFSDAVSSTERSWFQVIQQHIDSIVTDEEYDREKGKYTWLPPQTKEAYYYRKTFEKYYPGAEQVVPYFWLPKWSGNNNDPSARTLAVYNSLQVISRETVVSQE